MVRLHVGTIRTVGNTAQKMHLQKLEQKTMQNIVKIATVTFATLWLLVNPGAQENCVKITAMQWTKAPFGSKEGWRKDVKESSNDCGFVVGSLPSSNWASEVVQSPCVVGDDSWKISETI